MFWMWRVCNGPLKMSLGLDPAKPFSSVRYGRLCHVEKLSSCVHTCHPVVNGHATPDAFSLAIAATTSGHVFGGLLGSSPAFSNASLLYQNTVVELLKGKDSICPFGFE